MRFNSIKYLDGHGDVRLNFGANGRWVHKTFGRKVSGGEDIDISHPGFLLFVPEDGIVQMAAHSTSLNAYGRFEEDNNDEKRTLAVGGIFRTPEDLRKLLQQAKDHGATKILADALDQAQIKNLGPISTDYLEKLTDEALDLLTGQRKDVKWKEHVDQPDSDIASAVAREMWALLPPLFNEQNEPLGMVEPMRSIMGQMGAPVADNSRGENPVEMRDLVKKVNESSPQQFGFTFNVLKLGAIGDADMLAVHLRGNSTAFQLVVKMNVSNQPDPSSSQA